MVPPGHDLARRKTTDLAQVTRHPVVYMPPGIGLRAVVDRACAARSIRSMIAIEAATAESIAYLAARRLGVGAPAPGRSSLDAVTAEPGSPLREQ